MRGSGRGGGGGLGRGGGLGAGSGKGRSRPAAADPDKEAMYRAPTSRQRYHLFREYLVRQRREAKQRRREGAGGDETPAGEQDWLEKSTTRKDKDTRRRYLHRYYRWLRPFLRRLITLTATGLAVSAIDLVFPFAIGAMFDVVGGMISDNQAWRGQVWHVAEWSAWTWFGVLLGIGVASVILSKLISLWRNLATAELNAQATFRLRADLFRHLLRMPLDDLHAMKSGGVVSRLSTDVDHTVGLVQQAVLSPLQAAIRLVLVVGALLWVNWPVTLVATTLMIGVGLVYHGFLRRVRPIYRSMGEDRARVDGRLAETFGGVRVVRSFAREGLEGLAYGVGHHTAIRKQLWARARQQFLMLFFDLLMPATVLVIVAFGCWYVVRDHQSGISDPMTIGKVVTMQMLTWQVLNPVFMLIQAMNDTQRSLAAMERVYEVLERDVDKPDRPDARPAPARIDEIRIEDLSFAYGHESHDGEHCDLSEATVVLADIDLTIPGGGVVALVGPSGAGKTTITDLLARYHDPSRGRILLNGIDLRDYRLDDYRSLLATVQQETFLFDGSVRENVAYGRREAGEDEIVDACRRANALEFIEALPQGFDTVIGERGVKLSGGQRQRLSIARAILADPKLLILDEATSNLDTASEQQIQEAIAEVLRGRTTVIVAHRLSTIRTADRIVVLDGGRIVQEGTHDELMALGPGSMYYEMVERQRMEQVGS